MAMVLKAQVIQKMEKIKRTKVAEALKRTDFGATVNVKGWVRTHRSSKAVDFIALYDG